MCRKDREKIIWIIITEPNFKGKDKQKIENLKDMGSLERKDKKQEF